MYFSSRSCTQERVRHTHTHTHTYPHTHTSGIGCHSRGHRCKNSCASQVPPETPTVENLVVEALWVQERSISVKSGPQNKNVVAMEVIKEKKKMREWSRAQRKAGESVALVPTMGFLHAGHLSLIAEAKQHSTKVVVSIYVNPTQFAPGEDLSTYPRDLEGDLHKLKSLDVDVVFNPYDLYAHNGPEETPDVTKEAGSKKRNLPERWSTAAEQEEKKLRVADLQDSLEENLKPNGGMAVANMHDENKGQHETWIRVERLEKPLCGQNRPIFFRGVVTVVAKLFNIVEPDVAVFGKKDYQQWRVLCRMAQDLDFAVEIIGCPLLREDDGLAMSSRNVRLSDTERQQALSISQSLKEIEALVKMGEVDANLLVKCIIEKITAAGGKVDYAKIVEQHTLREVDKIKVPVVAAVAAHFGSVRLIDNVELQPPS